MNNIKLDPYAIKRAVAKSKYKKYNNAKQSSAHMSDEKYFANQILKNSSNYFCKKLINVIFK